jgi:type I restriction enzyme S subunit
LPNLELIEPEFLYYYFKTQEGVEQLFLASPGSADRNRTLNIKKLQSILIPVPNNKLQKQFLMLLNRVEEIKNQHNNTQIELNDLLPSLLYKTFMDT